MSKILFTILPYGGWSGISKARKDQFTAFPYGVLSIATYLKKNSDAECRIIDCNVSDDYKKEVQESVDTFNPDIIALSMMFDTSYKYLPGIMELIPQGRLILMGGAAAIASYKEILDENPGIDAVCYGEGEVPFLALAVFGKGVLMRDAWWATREKSMYHPIKAKVEHLDEVIDLDYSFVDIDKYPGREAFSPFASAEHQRQFYVITSRGCAFSCRFCMNSENPDKSIRYASVDAVIAHVDKLVKQGMKILTFYDDQILLNKKRAKELFRRLIPYHLKIECPNGLSVAFIDDELAGLMKEAGMTGIKLAIESGDPYVLNEIMNKPLKVGMVKPVVEILHKYGFWVQGFFVLGMPGETDDHRYRTQEFIKEVGLDWAQINTACPVRGSLLYRECLEKGYIQPHKVGEFAFKEYCIQQPDYPVEHIRDESYRMNLDVNFVNNHNMKGGQYWMAILAFNDVLTLVPDHAFAYYYLSVAHGKQCEYDKAVDALSKYTKIVAKDPFWKRWSREFGLMVC